MEWCERDAITWIKKDEDELQGEGVATGVDWQQNAEIIREDLAKLVQPKNYPGGSGARSRRIAKARERARIVQPQCWVREDFRITGALIQRFLNKAAGTAHGADQWDAHQLCDEAAQCVVRQL